MMSDLKGATALAFAIGAPMLFGVVGLATDFTMLNMKRTELQAAADAGALAAAKELSVANQQKNQIENAGRTYVLAQLSGRKDNVSVAVEHNKREGKVQVEVSEAWKPIFGEYFGVDMTPIVVRATATLSGATSICVLALDTAQGTSFNVNSSAIINAPACALYANSTSKDAMKFDNSVNVNANMVCSAGGATYSAGRVIAEPTTDCPAVADPFEDRSPPRVEACKIPPPGGKWRFKANEVATLDPGTYCGGIEVTGNATVTFASNGEYILKDGPLSISGSSVVRGRDVGFYFTGNSAILDLKGASTVEFSGRESGPMSGMLFFEDRSAPTSQIHNIGAKAVRELTGTIYFPRNKLIIDPKSKVADASAYTAIVVNQLELRGGPELRLNSNFSATRVPLPDGLRMQNQVTLTK